MTTMRTGFFAALGLLAAGWAAPAQAGALPVATPTVADAVGVQLVTDRGSWKKRKSRFRDHYDYRSDRFYHDEGRYFDRKHFKKKKKRKYFKRGYRRGYDEGYYDGRRHSRFERRYRHRYYDRDYGFRGGIYFGPGYYGGPGFRFRY